MSSASAIVVAVIIADLWNAGAVEGFDRDVVDLANRGRM
jgi:hypothetical protein